MSDDAIVKDVIIRNEESHRTVEGDIWSVTDFDTPQDFEKVKKLMKKGRLD